MPRISKTDITPAGEPVPLSPLLPGEDRVVYDELKRELLSELRPETAYARRLAVNLVNIEWEIDRHRHLLAAAVKLVAREVLER